MSRVSVEPFLFFELGRKKSPKMEGVSSSHLFKRGVPKKVFFFRDFKAQ